MTATNMCYNFVSFRCSPQVVVWGGGQMEWGELVEGIGGR